ncbi:response regulator [Taibaiella chishuiensis]|uniref:LuxR family two component transcriptional regulator n=1 Tax=Taibaiella chishuiensis TaxID=1434707 RepID=A0A2P8D8G4_9BACT|nr:response regulator transcription factor [Taibaiella chishuiensis]PSK93492.1 LuxR family two component transcriptional regulator [Taibaiella chishuiensis]
MKTYATLYLADDHQIVIDGLKLLIGSEEDIKIVGYANDGEAAHAGIRERKPDLALIDFSMPKMNGLEVIFSLRKMLPDTKFVILSMSENIRDIREAQNGGAKGYIRKNADRATLMHCLRAVLAGGTYFPDVKTIAAESEKQLFTPREIEIIKLVLDEYTSADIALRLHLSRTTIETHRKNINRKSGTNTPLGLSKFLLQHQIKF